MKRSPLQPGTKGLTSRGFNRAVRQASAERAALGRVSTGGLKRGRPLAAKSERRKAEDAPGGAWFVLRALVIARDIRGGRCAVADLWPEIPRCSGVTDAHHIRRTGAAGGPRLCDPRDLLGSCRRHHDAIHADVPLAKARGLLRDTPFVSPDEPVEPA